MGAGKYRHRGTIQQPVETPDALGQPVITWLTVASRIPVEFKDLSGRELWNAKQIQPDITIQATIRWMPSLTSKMRFIWHDGTTDRTLSIETPPTNPDGKRIELVCMCKEAK